MECPITRSILRARARSTRAIYLSITPEAVELMPPSPGTDLRPCAVSSTRMRGLWAPAPICSAPPGLEPLADVFGFAI